MIPWVDKTASHVNPVDTALLQLPPTIKTEAKLTWLLELCPQTARLTQNGALFVLPVTQVEWGEGISEHPE